MRLPPIDSPGVESLPALDAGSAVGTRDAVKAEFGFSHYCHSN